MNKLLSIIRTNKYNLEYAKSQLKFIQKYLSDNSLNNIDIVEIEVNIPSEEYKILDYFINLEKGTKVIIADINVLGRTQSTIINNIEALLNNGIEIVSIKQDRHLIKGDTNSNIFLNIIKDMILLEKSLMSLRTFEGLSVKKHSGVNLGKPKGTIQKSKFDKHKDTIIDSLSLGISVRQIAKNLGYNNHIGLNNYVKKRNLRESKEIVTTYTS